MRKAFKNALIYSHTDHSFIKGGLVIDDGIITGTNEEADAYDLCGAYVIPGLVDIHTHGRGGYDFNTATLPEMLKIKKLYAEKGVTTVIPTLASDTLENMLNSVRLIRAAGFKGAHIEGRYLNPSKKGAHAPSLITELSASEVELFAEAAGDMHLHFSSAFELDADGSFLAAIKAHGYTASLAHTNATYEEASKAVENGVTSFTHLFNTMPPIHHRAGGAVVAALTSDAFAEIICDGMHLAPETVKLVKTAKTADRVVLITDSMMGTGCADGEYSIAGNPVYLKDGRAVTPDGALAGSTLELLQGVKNYSVFTGASLFDAVTAATVNPSELLGIDSGRIEVGCQADIVVLDGDLNIKNVLVNGEVIV